MANVAAFRITFGFSDQADYWKTCLFFFVQTNENGRRKSTGNDEQRICDFSAYCNWMPPALMEVARFPVYFES